MTTIKPGSDVRTSATPKPPSPADLAVDAWFVKPPSPADLAVDAWFVETFHNLGIDVQLFNHFSAARDRLKERLAALSKE